MWGSCVINRLTNSFWKLQHFQTEKRNGVKDNCDNKGIAIAAAIFVVSKRAEDAAN